MPRRGEPLGKLGNLTIGRFEPARPETRHGSDPVGLGEPLRLAEDLATVDVLAGGRLTRASLRRCADLYEHFATNLYPVSHETEDFTKARVSRLQPPAR